MIRTRLLPLLASALLLGFAGGTFAQAPVAAPTSAGDQQFVQQAASAGMAEVQLGQLALTKSSNDEVKALAQRIVDDHTQANAQLKMIANGKSLDLPAQPDASAQQEAARLRALDGGAFDQAWAKTMVSDHEKAVKLFNAESTGAGDAQLKHFASATLPTLRAHLKSAQHLTAVPMARDQAMKHAMSTIPAPDHQSPTKPATPEGTPLNAPPSSLPTSAGSVLPPSH